ncbi:hypothetical protein Dda_5527 [Drechslerella dactyloides]|uniref:Uncharacterized protein n=1 Tax=Drechslerella dactyloides TaxID=74499 RepID=A0AAD6NKB3_DREDA|nr:hypothetical protein Dda_5527 [Drechslerella dactyloides]
MFYSWGTGNTVSPHPTPAIAQLGVDGRSFRRRTLQPPKYYRHRECPIDELIPQNGYNFTLLKDSDTFFEPKVEDLFTAAIRCGSVQPAKEKRARIWNCIGGVQSPNRDLPPYEMGVSRDEGVLTIYRGDEARDLMEGDPKQVPFSDAMFAAWKHCCQVEDRPVANDLKYVAIHRLKEKQLNTVAAWAFTHLQMDPARSLLVLNPDHYWNQAGPGEDPWSMYDAFLATPHIKAVQKMAANHRKELGYIFPHRIYIKYNVRYLPSGRRTFTPNLLIEMRRPDYKELDQTPEVPGGFFRRVWQREVLTIEYHGICMYDTHNQGSTKQRYPHG